MDHGGGLTIYIYIYIYMHIHVYVYEASYSNAPARKTGPASLMHPVSNLWKRPAMESDAMLKVLPGHADCDGSQKRLGHGSAGPWLEPARILTDVRRQLMCLSAYDLCGTGWRPPQSKQIVERRPRLRLIVNARPRLQMVPKICLGPRPRAVALVVLLLLHHVLPASVRDGASRGQFGADQATTSYGGGVSYGSLFGAYWYCAPILGTDW